MLGGKHKKILLRPHKSHKQRNIKTLTSHTLSTHINLRCWKAPTKSCLLHWNKSIISESGNFCLVIKYGFSRLKESKINCPCFKTNDIDMPDAHLNILTSNLYTYRLCFIIIFKWNSWNLKQNYCINKNIIICTH